MKTTIYILIALLTIFYVVNLQRANNYLKHEVNKIGPVIIQTVIGEKECPECICPNNSYDCPAR